ncbi:MAG: IctB family putative bicarbonate transporter, partial [Coleofasciculaceae cyanobacterium]
MSSAWQQFTLSNLRLQQWRGASYLYRLVGLLQAWRRGSWLMQWGETLGAILVALVFVLTPFVSNSLVAVLLVAGGAFWALLTLSDETVYPQGLPLKVTPIHLLVLLYFGISAVATALSPVKQAAATGLGKLALYLLFFALMARILRSPRIRSVIITLFLHVSLFVSAYGVQQWFFGPAALATWVDPTSPLSKTPRVYSFLGNPNLLASYLLPAIALSLVAFFAWRGWGPKALAVTMLFVNSYCLFRTGSLGGWIGSGAMAISLSVLLWYWWMNYLPTFWRKWLLPLVFGSMAGLLLLAMGLDDTIRLRVLRIFVGREDSSNNFRINVWSSVIEMIKDRPIIGIGPGNTAFNKVYPLYMQPRFTALGAYSIFLEVAVETGLIGFCCFLWLLIVTFNQGVQQLGRLRLAGNPDGFWLMGAIASMIGILAHGFVDTVWYRPEVNTLWWLMVAIVASYYTPPNAD